MKSLRAGVAGVAVLLGLGLLCERPALAAVAGTMSRWVGNELFLVGSAGTDAVQALTNGMRIHFGTGTNDFITSDGTNLIVGTGSGAGYVAFATPFTLDSVYVNGVPFALFIYGGGILPAHPFTVQAIRFNVRTAGSGGSTNVTFQATDGANTCNCTYACNQTTGSKRATCANGAGTGCVYAASAALSYSFTSVGDCGFTSADLTGNVSVEGIWQ